MSGYFHTCLRLSSKEFVHIPDLRWVQLQVRVLHPYGSGKPIVWDGKSYDVRKIDSIAIYQSDKTIADLRVANVMAYALCAPDENARYMYLYERCTNVTNEFIVTPPGCTPAESGNTATSNKSGGNRIFIVHGHDGTLKHAVARYVEKLGLEAVILQERADNGQTIIEKFEAESGVSFAVILATGDDFVSNGKAKLTDQYLDGLAGRASTPRARQNVIFELGYFAGKLGRNRTALIAEEGIDLPSDLHGVLYMPKATWFNDLHARLFDAGFTFTQKQIRDATRIQG